MATKKSDNKSSKKTSKRWIQKMNMKEGAFTKQAKRAGKSVQQFAKQVENNPSKYSSTTRKRASLARTFSKMSKKK